MDEVKIFYRINRDKIFMLDLFMLMVITFFKAK